ncbi:MAG: urate hydroxylase PuuD [Bacteroidetes bacterium]|nr:urate hydroxylase PuuD [Bacteroidota bacterium]MCH8245446.1 urate hydroxylase PuuD [Bacteroidota bacterium]
MDAYDLSAIVQMVVRWVHVFAAILWIGQTYLFNFMERSLEATDEENVVGNLWMVHGGGFYFVQKQKLPEILPLKLHWFKWEAATTWISGAILLGLAYYVDGLLVTPELSFGLAASVGIGSLIITWFVYDGLVRSPLGKHPILFALVTLLLILALHYGFSVVMSSRAAWIHVGAVLGTIMAANVWIRILPVQRQMLVAAKKGEAFDAGVADMGPMRSKHNSYTVIALVLIMIGNHYPTISYGSRYSTLILGLVVVIGWIAARMFSGPLRK